jgi:hypothetical protein
MYLLTGASRMEKKRPTNFDNRRGRHEHGNKVKQTKLAIDFINELGEKKETRACCQSNAIWLGRYAALVSNPPIESAPFIHLIISLNVTFIFSKKMVESIFLFVPE